jgi:hypothetical protein
MPTTPRSLAKLAGVLYLIPMFLGPFSMMYVPSVTVVRGDAAATAARMVASEGLVRWGVLSDAVIVLSEVALTAVLFTLFAPAGRTLARTAVFARLAMTVAQAVNLLPLLAALHILGAPRSLSALDLAQRQSLALFAIELHGLGVHVWEALFGLHCAALAVLIYRSGYFPKALGALMALAAFGYTLNGLGNLALPGGAAVYAAVVGIAAVVGEVPFVLWLVVKGAREERWRERAAENATAA